MAKDTLPPFHGRTIKASRQLKGMGIERINSLSDHGIEPLKSDGLTYPLGDFAPANGDLFNLIDGIGWVRTPVPGPLGHINNWLLNDDMGGGEFAIVDTGLFIPPVIEIWKKLFDGPILHGRKASKVIITHYHPDHVGCAGWLANRFKARVHMNRTEWLLTRMLISEQGDEVPVEAIENWRFNGWSEELIASESKKGWGRFARAVSRLPMGHNRLEDGKIIAVGDRMWRVMIGRGHSPEHACLIDDEKRVMIAGDQILPRITSNISFMLSEPDADPLGEWLASIDHFREELDGDLLVLPAHGRPFTGVHARLDILKNRHLDALDKLEAGLREKEMRVVDSFPFLFKREIGPDVYGLATGEARATLHHLEVTGRVRREMRGGVAWYKSMA